MISDILKEVQETIADEIKRLSNGGCAEYADYREAIGYIRGLRDLESIIDKIESENAE